MSSTFASRSGRRKRAQAQPNRSSTNEITHEFTMNDLLESSIPPMETHVERMSNDRKRRFQDVVPVEPPSPMKRQTIRSTAESLATGTTEESPMGLPFSPVDELYNLDLDNSYNDEVEDLHCGQCPLSYLVKCWLNAQFIQHLTRIFYLVKCWLKFDFIQHLFNI
uniref:Uncharacterized protein n=1 Tax=Mycena chlorophos TaxID=658473 RepID=A0ABQ0L681_MYCCL|nr:predicted protein [Mycena chlorophos]